MIHKYQSEIGQMMFVFGEVSEPLPETTELVEEIVRSQVIEIIVQAVLQAQKRGSRFLTAEDLIFLIRHDRPKVNRLRTFLSWKEVRRNVKDKDGQSGGPEAEELVEEVNNEKPKQVKKQIKFSWDILNYYGSVLSDDEDDDIDEEQREAYEDQVQRLKHADDLTKTMSKEEYIYFSECRQASFVFKKTKRFKEWCMMSTLYDNKPNNDIIDILGFLSYEMVSKLTETALEMKRSWEAREDEESQKKKKGGSSANTEPTLNEGACDLFAKPNFDQSPLKPIHVHEAFRKLQRTSSIMNNFNGGLVRTTLSLI
ncbi:transcription initiation factor IID, 18kD subunit-domain-containing protein [Cladochytrium replicatum]|nr:transcription initiation factor IID, 18kD subunit-domain-containing protein [Cladochytrium replicatum]